jgi:hypothetical protein
VAAPRIASTPILVCGRQQSANCHHTERWSGGNGCAWAANCRGESSVGVDRIDGLHLAVVVVVIVVIVIVVESRSLLSRGTIILATRTSRQLVWKIRNFFFFLNRPFFTHHKKKKKKRCRVDRQFVQIRIISNGLGDYW